MLFHRCAQLSSLTHSHAFRSALPILRQLGAQGGGTSLLKSVREGDTSMLKVWVGLEIRKYLQASAEQVESCVQYDQLSPNI